jgi:hypothetical protein
MRYQECLKVHLSGISYGEVLDRERRDWEQQ